MTISLYTHIIELPLKKPFRIQHGVFPVRRNLILELQSENLTGFGELSEITYYGWNLENFLRELRSKQDKIQELSIDDPREIKPYLEELFPGIYPLQSALDCALWDLYTQKQGLAVHEYLDLDIHKAPQSSYTIGIDEPDIMLEEFRKNQWPAIKLKLGSIQDSQILEIFSRQNLAKPIRLDINSGWSLQQFEAALPLLKIIKPEFIEQPLPESHISDMTAVKDVSPFPLIADESCQTFNDVDKCADKFDGINIKLMKCGGITDFLRMADRAREVGLKVMGGCMTETAIGIGALCQLAPLMDYIDADGAELTAVEPAKGLKVKKGQILYPDLPGIGAYLE